MGNRTKIIGGMFGLELTVLAAEGARVDKPTVLQGRCQMLATARSALTLLVETLRPAQAWLPSYLCDVMAEAVAHTGTPLCFYPVSADLQITDEAWLRKVGRGDIVVFIDYFGFNAWESTAQKVRAAGAFVVEDACQAFLNDTFSAHSHFVIASPRKFIGVPDGGVLLARPGVQLPSITLAPPPSEWWFDAFAATLQRGEFDRHGGDRKWFELFRRFDPNGPLHPHAMSEFSVQLLARFDYAEIARRRRANYEFLLSELGPLALFTRLPNGVVPLGFPVRLAGRDRVRQALFAADIFPPVHWPLGGAVPETFIESHRLAREITTLPCDQRYDESDMKRLVSCLRRVLGS